MKIGIIGLGKMGSAIAHRLIKKKFQVFSYDINKNAIEEIRKIGATSCADLSEIAQNSDVIWLMLPAGKIIDDTIEKLLPNLSKDSTIIDGGNSHYSDSILRAKKLEKNGVIFLDCGTSGGLQGKELGFCLMIGGNKNAYEKNKKIFEAIAIPGGYDYIGESGSGHYVKMIHNGIEYALLQSYAEGFQILNEGIYQKLDLEKISKLWIHGSIIRSWILELTNQIFYENQEFKNISGAIGGGQTGNWTLQFAKQKNIPIPMIEKSIEIRKWSNETDGNYSTKLVSLLRYKFGGHELKR